jgi:alkylhydroperoxidase family enzyme
MIMLKYLMKRLIRNLEKRYAYDAAYMHEILDTSPRAMFKMMLAQGMSLHHEGLPPAAWHAARVVAARHEDCGPCTQLVVDYALAAGVDPALLRALVARDHARLPPDALVAARLAEAVLANEPTDELRAEARQRFGPQGLVALAYAIAFTRVYPTIKRTMGYAHTCERVVVGGESVPAARAA